jgi:hypothetical protein
MTIESFNKERVVQLMKSGYGVALKNMASLYSVPIFWIASKYGEPEIVANGTSFLMDLGGGPFLVTAKHVYDEYLLDKQKYKDLRCVVGEIEFDLDNSFIDANQSLDLVTFRLPSSRVYKYFEENKNSKSVVNLIGSLPDIPTSSFGMGVFFAGFTGKGRNVKFNKRTGLIQIDWLGSFCLMYTKSITDHAMTVQIEKEFYVDTGITPLPEEWGYAGCSGAPVFSMSEKRGVFRHELVGVVSQSMGNDLVRISRADYIHKDGRIDQFKRY